MPFILLLVLLLSREEKTTSNFQNAVFLLPANEVWGKVIFLHLFVILFTECGGSASVHDGITPPTPLDHVPPGPCTPLDHAPPRTMHPQDHAPLLPCTTRQDHAHPPEQSMLGDTVNAWAVRILLECSLVKRLCLRLHIPFTKSSPWIIFTAHKPS